MILRRPEYSVSTVANEPFLRFALDDGIVVGEVGEDAAMEAAHVPSKLQAQLGPEATAGLLELFETARQEWTADVTISAVERFERRLAEEAASWRVALAQTEAALRLEISDLRHEMREGHVALRQEMHEGNVALRQEMREGAASLRQEMRESDASLRQEMHEVDASLRQEMHEGFARLKEENLAGRFELLKWCFVFWVGQVFAVAGVVAVVVRLMER